MNDFWKQVEKQIKEQYNRVMAPVTDEFTHEEVFIASPDGVKLRTEIYKPVGVKGPYPTVVQRTCYPQNEPLSRMQSEELAKRGFASVVQWCRGVNGSEGEWTPYYWERYDGMPLVYWLDEQPWVKNMGFTGASYLALTGWAIADISPEKMKTMYLTVLGTEWHTSLWQEGSFRQDVYTSWTMENTGTKVEADYMTSAKYRPHVKVDEDLWHCRLDFYRNEISKPSRLDPFWTKGKWGTIKNVPRRTEMPIYIGEGWYDIHVGNMLETYANLTEESRKHSVVRVNPGNHMFQPVIPGQKHQANAEMNDHQHMLEWFKTILLDEKMPEPGINVYRIGADQWETYPSYPFVKKEDVKFYLSDKELLAQPGADSKRAYDYDPDNPVMSHGGGTLFKLWDDVGSLEQPEPDFRPDVLSYVSEPLENDIDITGRIKAHLFVESDAKDTAFTMKVMEVFPDGKAYNIRNGITTLGFRNNSDVKQSYDGGVVEITIDSWDIVYRLQKGSRLRVDISSSNFPEFSVHPNTDKVWSEEEHPVIARNTVLSGKEHPSYLELPMA